MHGFYTEIKYEFDENDALFPLGGLGGLFSHEYTDLHEYNYKDDDNDALLPLGGPGGLPLPP